MLYAQSAITVISGYIRVNQKVDLEGGQQGERGWGVWVCGRSNTFTNALNPLSSYQSDALCLRRPGECRVYTKALALEKVCMRCMSSVRVHSDRVCLGYDHSVFDTCKKMQTDQHWRFFFD